MEQQFNYGVTQIAWSLEFLPFVLILIIVSSSLASIEFFYKLRYYIKRLLVPYLGLWLFVNILISIVVFSIYFIAKYNSQPNVLLASFLAALSPTILSNTDLGFLDSKSYRIHLYKYKINFFKWAKISIENREQKILGALIKSIEIWYDKDVQEMKKLVYRIMTNIYLPNSEILPQKKEQLKNTTEPVDVLWILRDLHRPQILIHSIKEASPVKSHFLEDKLLRVLPNINKEEASILLQQGITTQRLFLKTLKTRSLRESCASDTGIISIRLHELYNSALLEIHRTHKQLLKRIVMGLATIVLLLGSLFVASNLSLGVTQTGIRVGENQGIEYYDNKGQTPIRPSYMQYRYNLKQITNIESGQNPILEKDGQ